MDEGALRTEKEAVSVMYGRSTLMRYLMVNKRWSIRWRGTKRDRLDSEGCGVPSEETTREEVLLQLLEKMASLRK